MKPKAQVEYRPIAELKELPGNPRTIKKDQFEKLKTSIQDNADYFEARPIILSDRTGELVILAGNQRYKAAKAIGLKEVPTILLPNLSEEREKEIIIRDNVENGDWDWDALANSWDADVLDSWGVKMPTWDENQTEYQQFVDKFKPKLTTDDCYTPSAVFEAVEKWVRKEYNLGDIENIRPFKPEGDYQAENYDGKLAYWHKTPKGYHKTTRSTSVYSWEALIEQMSKFEEVGVGEITATDVKKWLNELEPNDD